MKAKLNLVALVGILLFSSCALQKGHLRFQPKTNETIATPSIKEYLKLHPNPSIVLKAPNSENKSTQSDPNSYIYNAIEKELLIAGFDVKDRGLFNEVVGKSNEINYSELKKLTNTELLLELVNVSTKIEYRTNKFYTKDGKENVVNQNFTKYGAVIEFKLTIIETNQFAGSYSFYYSPCTSENSGCECEVAYKNFASIKVYPYINFCRGENNKNNEYEYISENIMEKFVREGVKLMINEMKN